MVEKVLVPLVPLNYLSNFWRNLEMLLITYEINLILTWSEKCVLSNAPNQATTIVITDTKLFILVITLSTQDIAKLLQQLKFGLKRTINWNKYHSKITTQMTNQYLDYLISLTFQGVNRIFVLSFENVIDRIGYTEYILLATEIKDYNVMIDGEIFFDPPIKDNLRTYDSIRKISTDQEDDYTTGCLLI